MGNIIGVFAKPTLSKIPAEAVSLAANVRIVIFLLLTSTSPRTRQADHSSDHAYRRVTALIFAIKAQAVPNGDSKEK